MGRDEYREGDGEGVTDQAGIGGRDEKSIIFLLCLSFFRVKLLVF